MNRKKILIVDDEQGFTAMIKLNLESTGEYSVQIENNASKALSTALHFRPDLILLDVIMPELEGPDIAIQFKGNHNLDKVPIVFLTATVTKDEVDSQNGLIGGRPFIAKPSTLNDLLNSIERNIITCKN